MWLPILPWFFNKPVQRAEYAEPKTWHKEEAKSYQSHREAANVMPAGTGFLMMIQHECNRTMRHSQIGKIVLK